MATRCDDCTQLIVFAKTSSGKWLPFDAYPALIAGDRKLWKLYQYNGEPTCEESRPNDHFGQRFTMHLETCSQRKDSQ